MLVPQSGWDKPEKRPDGNYQRWLVQSEGTMWLTLPLNSAPAQTRLHFEAAAYYRERTVAVLLNGQEVAQLKVSPEKQSYNLSLEAKWLKPGDNLITLRPLEPADIPAEREQTRDIRTLTIVLTNLGVSPD